MAKIRKRQDGDPSAPESHAADQAGGNGQHHPADPERISNRAYELYLARGGADGQAWDDWLTAERELTQPTSSSRGDSGE